LSKQEWYYTEIVDTNEKSKVNQLETAFDAGEMGGFVSHTQVHLI
jgi:hypothetical protein